MVIKNMKKELKATYLTHGQFHKTIRNFLDVTQGDYLEIGVFWGVFLAELAMEYPKKRVFGIDPYIADGHTGQPQGTILTDVEEICRYNLDGLDNAKLYKSTTKDFLLNRDNAIDNVTCILVDGSHHYEDVMIDIELIQTLPSNNPKLIVFDDLGIAGVRKAVDDFEKLFKDRIHKKVDSSFFYIDGTHDGYKQAQA